MAEKEVLLITGGSGYIGGTLIERLAGNYPLVGLDRAAPPDPLLPHIVSRSISAATNP